MPLDRDLETGASGEPVRELHNALLALGDVDAVAQVLSDRRFRNAFDRERREARFDEATKRLVAELQRHFDLETTGKWDPATRELILRLIRERLPDLAERGSKEEDGRVTGAVLDERGRRLPGLTVQLEHVRAGGRAEPLGRDQTNRSGAYAIDYARASALAAQGGRLNLRVSALDGEAPLGHSAVLFNAPAVVEGFDIVIAAESLRADISDFERVRRDVGAAAEQAGLDPVELQETTDRPDVSLLAAETGHAPEKIALLVTALRIERDSEGRVPAEVAYGLGSEGVPFGAAALAGTPQEVLAEALATAVQQGVVSPGASEKLQPAVDHAAARLRDAGIERVAESAIGEIVADVAGREPARRFFAIAAQHDGDADGLWRKVEVDATLKQLAGVEDDAALKQLIADLRFATEASVLVGGRPDAVKMLRRLKQQGEIDGLSSLAAWTERKWEQHLDRAEVTPPGLAEGADAETQKAARSAYARGLDRVVEVMHPRLYARHRIAESGLAGKEEVTRFLDVAEDFSLAGTNLRTYLREKPDLAEALRGTGGAERTLSALTRVARVSRRAAPAVTLVGDGLTSAQAIAGTGPLAFAQRYADSFGSRTLALEAHARAQLTALAAAEVFLEAAPHGGHADLRVTPPSGVAELPAFPDWATLFGAADGCACRHCQSVTSPGAYLVDTLQFLSRRASRATENGRRLSALAILRRPGRRPDLAEIELSCENSDTVLPYIDLVNEVLEDAVAPLPAFTPRMIAGPVATEPGRAVIATASRDELNAALGLTADNDRFAIAADATVHSLSEGQPWRGATPVWRVEDRLATYTIATTDGGGLEISARGRNTRGPSAERLLSPQYTNAAAYERLADATYPWSLPFRRALSEARIGLSAVNGTLAAVLQDFASGRPEERRRRHEVAIERLGLSPVDAALVTWTPPASEPPLHLDEPWRHWGFIAVDATTENPVPDPADRTTPITDGRWVDILAGRLDVLLDRSQLAIEELLALLDTRYINPVSGDRRAIELVSPDQADSATCETRKLSLHGLDEAALLRIARLVRLSRRSGLSFREIDVALTALGATAPDGAFLDSLGQLVALRDRLGVDWNELAACFTPLDPARLGDIWMPTGAARSIDHDDGETRPSPTLYEQLFRPADNPAPGLRWFPADPGGLAELNLSDGLSGLAAAFSISAADATALVTSDVVMATGTDGLIDTKASLANVARLHRHAVLMRGLGIGAGDYLLALRLFDRNPFTTPAGLADFVASVETALASSLTFEELVWLTRWESPVAEKTREEADTQLLDGLRSALKAIVADNRFVPVDAEGEAPTLDPEGALTRRKLVALGIPASLADAAVAALSDTAVHEIRRDALPDIAPDKVELAAYEVQLARLPGGVKLASLSESKLTYDRPGRQLRAKAVLTDGERQALVAASADEDYRAALLQLFALQDISKGRARFDPVTKTLRFAGPMSALWLKHLNSLSDAPVWRDAVRALHKAPRDVAHGVLRRWNSKVATPLPKGLPIKLPAAFDDRLYLDRSVEPALLRLRGPLFAAEVDSLKAAASGDERDRIEFCAALDRLVAEAATVEPAAELITEADLDALMDERMSAGERYYRLLEWVLPGVADASSDAALVQLLGAWLGIGSATAEGLCAVELIAPGGTRTAAAVLRDPEFVASPAPLVPNLRAFRPQHLVLRLLRQAALLAARFRLDERDLALLARFADWPDIAQLPVERLPRSAPAPVSAAELLRFADYARLRDRMPGGRTGIEAVTDTAADAGVTAERLRAVVAERLRRPEDEIATLCGADLLNLSLPTDFRTEFGLLRVTEALERLDRLGLPAVAVAALRATPLSPDAGRAAIAAVGAGMDTTQWREIGRGLYDRIRVEARDALVAYLLAHGRPAENGIPAMRWRTAGELFGHFLIDVEMGACMETSRLRQAMSSVQLFVQRCQLGLEREIDANPQTDDGWRQWEWMRSYRVWEANRKVFLWPENLLDPQFLDVKSQLFREFEADLGQGEVTIESAARAALGYLQKLKQIANLHPVTMAREATTGGEVQHVIAALPGDPIEYYYRRRDYTRIWTPWEKVDLAINSEHVLLYIWHGRPFLFWLEFTPRAKDPKLQGDSIKADNVFDIKLGWSEFADGKWLPQRRSRRVITLPRRWVALNQDQAEADTRAVVFRIDRVDGALVVAYFVTNPPTSSHQGWFGIPLASYRAFQIEYPHAEPETVEVLGYILFQLQKETLVLTSGRELTSNVLRLPHENDHAATAAVQVSSIMRITTPPSDVLAFHGGPFLFRDRRRAFFITPSGPRPKVVVGLEPEHLSDSELEPLPVSELEHLPAGSLIDPVREYNRAINEIVGPWASSHWRAPATGAQPLRAVRRAFEAEQRLADRLQAEAEAAMLARNKAAGGSVLDALGVGGVMPGDAAAGRRALGLRQTSGSEATVAYGANSLVADLLVEHNNALSYSMMATDAHAVEGGGPWPRRYNFEIFYHPYVDVLTDVLRRRGLAAMLARDVQLRPYLYMLHEGTAHLFKQIYASNDNVVAWQHSADTLDFDPDGAYSLYNWELFFHIPMMIADRLAASQRFGEARTWLHAIFDPTDQSSSVIGEDGTEIAVGAARYWQTKPLFQNSVPKSGPPAADDTRVERERIERILTVLATAVAPDADARLTPDDRRDLDQFRTQLEEMRRKPFQPYAVARLRTSAFQRAVVMKYLDILIQWGDQLFRRDTMESINAATQLYVLAAEFRGQGEAVMPRRAVARPQTYGLLERRLDEGSNALVEIETFVPPSAAPNPAPAPGLPPPAMLAFCVPQNDKLSAYWDTIADRLFKIHNCLNIEGVARRLALFEPPIEPALLARAVAAGVDIGAALADLDGPTPGRRFRVMIRQAAELAGDVRALGSALLSAWEKRDSEMLSRLRAVHERRLLERAKEVRELQLKEAEASLLAMRSSRNGALDRFRHYRRLLGETDLADPPEGAAIAIRAPRVDTATHSSKVFKLVASLISQIPGASQPPGTELGGILVNTYEDFELAMMAVSQRFQLESSACDVLAGMANIVPNFNVAPGGAGPTFGGSNIGAAFSAIGASHRGRSGAFGFAATMAGRAGQYASRADDWILQRNLAAREIMQIDRQLVAAELRRQIADRDLTNHERQLEDLGAYEDALREKFTNQELYDWMAARLADLHFQMYQLAYDCAKRAQRAARLELQRPQMDYIRFGQWDGLRKGLLAGESLSLDIRRLELAYDEFDTRDEAMVKHVSLARIDPTALVRLRETGSATFALPEALFDLDCPGQYLRRIKTVALTIPSVTGPYTGIHCRLTLLRSSTRVSSVLSGRKKEYARDRTRDDPRFDDRAGPVQSIVTSSAQNDSGLFEASLEDPRYLPFEGAGAISEWRLELPAVFRSFDYNTITDVVLHLRYTARNGGEQLRGAVELELKAALNALQDTMGETGLVHRFSLRYETPTAWHRFLEEPTDGLNVIDLPIARDRLPFFIGARPVSVQKVIILPKVKSNFMADYRRGLTGDLRPRGETATTALSFSPWLGGLLRATWEGSIDVDRSGSSGAPPTSWQLRLQVTSPTAGPIAPTALDDVEILMVYRLN